MTSREHRLRQACDPDSPIDTNAHAERIAGVIRHAQAQSRRQHARMQQARRPNAESLPGSFEGGAVTSPRYEDQAADSPPGSTMAGTGDHARYAAPSPTERRHHWHDHARVDEPAQAMSAPKNLDEARLRPHLRQQQPHLIVSPDNTMLDTPTLQLGGKRTSSTAALGNPGDLRGIPVVGARGVGGVSPGTHPEHATLNKLDRTRNRAA